MLKLLLIITSALSHNKADGPIQAMQQFLRYELSLFVYKILLGLFLTSAVIFSFVELGLGLKLLFSHFQSGLIYEIVFFFLCLSLGLILLYFLFKHDFHKISKNKGTETEGIDFQLLGVQFFEGVLEGYARHQENEDPKEEKNDRL